MDLTFLLGQHPYFAAKETDLAWFTQHRRNNKLEGWELRMKSVYIFIIVSDY